MGLLVTALRTQVEKLSQTDMSRVVYAGEIRKPQPTPVRTMDLFQAMPSGGANTSSAVETVVAAQPAVKNYRLIGQVLNSYILVEKDNGLHIVDQHAAHERILYEQFSRAADGQVQQLAVPISLDFGASAHFLADFLEPLSRVGFDLEHFGGTTYLLRSLPRTYRGDFSEGTILDIIADLSQGRGLHKVDQVAISMACHTGIRANTRLSPPEMIELLDLLYACQVPATCPHGRPVELSFTESELYKLFHPR
jgi:DNA mismatch repair protein MutL